MFTTRHAHTRVAAAGDAADGDVPLLVVVLAGNSVISATILAWLNTADATHLRQLHPAVLSVVVTVPWRDMGTSVMDVVRWRAAFPAAVGARVTGRALDWRRQTRAPAVAALGGVMHLNLQDCADVSDDLLLRLPPSLRTLNVSNCAYLTAAASFAHLTALTSLDCSWTAVVSERTDGLPPSLQALDICDVEQELRTGASLAHLRQLRVLRADWSAFDAALLASLPPGLEELHAAHCKELTPVALFAHLTALRTLDVAHSAIGDGSLASLPPCLVSLDACGCKSLSPAAVLPHLPALELLDVSGTGIGDALVASLPASLAELRLAGCGYLTAGATFDHMPALRVLHCIDTKLAPAALAACRARGCVVPAARQLFGHQKIVNALTLLGDGRLASSDTRGEVWVWDVAAAGGGSMSGFLVGDEARGMVVLGDDRRLAFGTVPWEDKDGCIKVWNVEGGLPARRTTIACGVLALAVLSIDRLAAGCGDGAVRIVEVIRGAVVATLSGHTGCVTALAVLPGGRLASGSRDTSVRVWDVGTRTCVALLVGHTSEGLSLAMLVDGRLASGSEDCTVRLWDVDAHTCVGVLGGLSGVTALAALRDGRLATASTDGSGTIRLWDTRPAAVAGASPAASRAAGDVPVEVVAVIGGGIGALLSLPDGRLACGSGGDLWGVVNLLELPPPAP